MPDANLPDPLYYLTNFRTALTWVRARYSDLLTPAEGEYFAVFSALPEPSQALLVRLLMRKGVHFRLSKLSYSEIGDIAQAAAPLLALGWLTTDAPLTLAEIGEVLVKAEVLAHLPLPEPRASLKKPELLAQLPEDSKPFAHWCPTLQDTLLSVTISDFADLVRLLFFGNLAQQWSEFVLAELGIFRYESVAFTSDSRAFQCRQDVDDYLALRALRERFYQAQPIDDILPPLLAFESNNAYLLKRRSRLIFSIAQHLEKSANAVQALALYEQTDVGEARWRQVRILENLGETDQALARAEAFAEKPVSDEEAQRLTRALTRLRKKHGLPALPRAKACAESKIQLCLAQHHSVEIAVREHLHRADAPVYYVENTLFSSLFGLLCWKAIFAPVPGAFFHPFHSAPVDFYAEDFVAKRQALFDDGLAQLETGEYRAQIKHRFEQKYGLQSPLVFWGLLDQNLLDTALACINPLHLKAIFLRFLQDLKANRTGMPDLIQFYPARQSFRLIEVKGPGDRLQDNQKRWLTFAAAHGIEVDVCYVSWAGDAL